MAKFKQNLNDLPPPGFSRDGLAEFLEEMEDMIRSGDFDWAHALPSIYEWIKNARMYSPKHRKAIINIKNAQMRNEAREDGIDIDTWDGEY